MEPFEEFEQQLREMLLHLYDPVYRPPDSLWAHLRFQRDEGVQAIRDEILRSIEDMKPSERVPLSARAWRIYGMLRYRFVEDLPQETAAERLGITARHLRRDIIEAVHALALYIWEKRVGHAESDLSYPSAGSPPDVFPIETSAVPGGQWQAQLRRELESLLEMASSAVANVPETVESALRLAKLLTARRGIQLLTGDMAPDLNAAIHPTALRQIMIAIIDGLARGMTGGTIHMDAGQSGSRIFIQISASPVSEQAFSDFAFLREFLQDQGGSVEVLVRDGETRITLELLVIDRCVLVVDDNPDIVHLYRRYAAGTRYTIQSIGQGAQLFSAVGTYHPDVIVLDVMLPDVDGWDLLSRLHEHPSTRTLPVVICSVMRERELALALGARAFLAKPVQRGDFIGTLDTVLAQA